MDSQVFGDHHGSKTNDSYSKHSFQPNYIAKAEYLNFWAAYFLYLNAKKAVSL